MSQQNNDKKLTLVFDWGNTLMVDYPDESGPMVEWSRVAPMKGVNMAIPELAERCACYVASNAKESDAEQMKAAFARLGLERYFSGFYTSKELGACKPDVEFFEKLAEKLECAPEQITYVGDSYENDIVPAKKAGMSTILVKSEQGEYPDADSCVDSIWSMLEL